MFWHQIVFHNIPHRLFINEIRSTKWKILACVQPRTPSPLLKGKFYESYSDEVLVSNFNWLAVLTVSCECRIWSFLPKTSLYLSACRASTRQSECRWGSNLHGTLGVFLSQMNFYIFLSFLVCRSLLSMATDFFCVLDYRNNDNLCFIVTLILLI